jgi:endonuclease/exonuclease/phosphatase family metal-dependent hydrolase
MRLLSYNIHKGIGGRDRLYRLERVIAAIEHERPDVILLQEVDRNVRRSRFHDQPALLQQHFGFEHALFQLNHHLRQGGYGNLLLSRWPLAVRHQVSLRVQQKKNRGAQIAVLETPAGALRVVNWHLGLAEDERVLQAHRLLRHPLYRECGPVPTLIAGDFNDWRNRLHAGPFARHGLRQLTAPPSRYRSFPAYMPVGALDKAFACERVKVERAHVVNSKLTRKASDHLPLVVDFELA